MATKERELQAAAEAKAKEEAAAEVKALEEAAAAQKEAVTTSPPPPALSMEVESVHTIYPMSNRRFMLMSHVHFTATP